MTRNNSPSKAGNFRWLLIPASAVLLAVFLNSFVLLSAIVPSESMADTVKKGSLVVASRLSYKKDDVCRGDIVLFTHPNIDEPYVIKRVIALPGDTVEIRDGYVYLNGADSPLDEPYVSNISHDTTERVTLSEGCFFVLGDNRSNSTDSRNADFGFVHVENIRAKALFTLLPRVKRL